MGSGPVCLPGARPEPQWITMGIRASASSPHACWRHASAGPYASACTCALNTRAPASTALRTYVPASGSG